MKKSLQIQIGLKMIGKNYAGDLGNSFGIDTARCVPKAYWLFKLTVPGNGQKDAAAGAAIK